MAKQPEGLRVWLKPYSYFSREQLLETLTFWFGDYNLAVTPTSELTLIIPRAETYGRVLNKLAETIYRLEQGKTASRVHQTKLPREATP